MSGIKSFFDTIMGSTKHKNEQFMQRAANPRASIAYSVVFVLVMTLSRTYGSSSTRRSGNIRKL